MKLRQYLSFPALCVALVTADGMPVLSYGGAATVLAAVSLVASSDAQALPRDRMAGRQTARYYRRTGQGYMAPAARATGRATSRARRRGYYGLPAGAAPYRYGGYSYYRAGGRFYYPYVYGGRTVYIDVDVENGYPGPPPPAGSIEIDF